MSIAGIRSNRGDSYQTLIAFDWALTVLSDPEFQWIEIDSVTYPVDDVVVGKNDGTLICCQCKKNQIDFKAWTIADLTDELHKAAKLLGDNEDANVRFYSRSPFGVLAKLHEHSTLQPNETSYRESLGKELFKIDAELITRISPQAPHLSTYDFIRRTSFETSPDFDIMKNLLNERLRNLVCTPSVAYDALLALLDQYSARIDDYSIPATSQHRLTKEDLRNILHQSGAMIVTAINLEEARKSFTYTSAIGRIWHRDIAGHHIRNPALNDLLSAIDERKRAILLTGLPGSGKTCIMLALQEALEQRAQTRTDIVPLFIQAREFADFITVEERQAQGLPDQWVEKAASLAEEAQVVVIIDSLDVLSIAREHAVLKYFLAQIDRLLLNPNITVVTACRTFDRHYDRRIAIRKWDYERECLPLNWESEIAPLLDALNINTAAIDVKTRELIRIPRELALFVELSQREGSFNVVTSQELAQRYINTIIRKNESLGEEATQAIEKIADEMLKMRKLAVPHQRFNASQDIRRLLLSLNVLQETHNGELTFGHQTLLDVLVISGAVRRGVTLNEFIHGLPPVPFVRPSIRSFVAYLATGNRNVFRKQLRTVLTSSVAFHIRRLVAESFAEQIPQDDDWPMIFELRNEHREIFQVIYTQGRLIEWHHFWFSHLVPVLIDATDADGMLTHAHWMSQWKNEDAACVLAFWADILQLDWIDGTQFDSSLSHYLSEIDKEHLAIVAPLLELLLSRSRQEHSFLGRAVARCVTEGLIEDNWLWHYIAGEISKEDVIEFRFDNKLHCQPHEFGKGYEKFIAQRLEQSTAFLDLALKSIEHWSQIKSSRYGDNYLDYDENFLYVTSYEDTHNQIDIRDVDSENILFDAIESAIIGHAKANSEWWQANCERLCFNREGALRYFAVLACTAKPEGNIDLIGRILTNRKMLESKLSFELGTLMQAAFRNLEIPTQDAVMDCILSLWEERLPKEKFPNWIFKERAEFIVTIPPCLRSPEVQTALDEYEKSEGSIIRQPNIMTGGLVRSPFLFDVFHQTSDSGVLRLLVHYAGNKRDFDEFLVGGERQVSIELIEASSRHPIRFLQILTIYWADLSDIFRDAIMSGAAEYLRYRFGNFKTNGKWKPIDEPEAPFLASIILEELERHPTYWHFSRAASKALQACAHVVKDTRDAERLVFLIIGFASLHEEISESNVDLINTGINMTSGHVAEAIMILANNFQELDINFPELLEPTLLRFAGNEHPAIRALILRHLPYLQSQYPRLGWKLFHLAMQNANGLWQFAEPSLYHAFQNHFEIVAPLLTRIHHEGSGKDMETWGRISALAAMVGHIDLSVLLNDLKVMDSTEAWRGAASVWTHPKNIKHNRKQCFTGIEAGLKINGPNALVVSKRMGRLFHENNPTISIPIDLIKLFFAISEGDSEDKRHRFFDIGDWLNATSHSDPVKALTVTEIYLTYVKRTNAYLYNYSFLRKLFLGLPEAILLPNFL